jgi:hypothetical protein
MTFTSGKKPMINAAAARNPDGSWTLGVINDTSSSYNDATSDQLGWAARTFNVTFHVQELEGVSAIFHAVKSYGNNSGYIQPTGDFTMTNGQVTITGLNERDFVTMRSDPINHTPVPTPTPPAVTAACGTSIIIDGNINEATWNDTGWTSVSKTVYGTSGVPGGFKVRWDANYMYLAVRVDDAVINTNSGADYWNNDTVEVYLDMINDRPGAYFADDFIYAFTVNASDFFEKSGRKTGVLFASSVAAGTAYYIEAAIPWTTLGRSPFAGMSVGFDIMFDDNRGSGVMDAQTAWNGTAYNYITTEDFGNVVLGMACGTTATITATQQNTPTMTQTPGQSPSETATAVLTATKTVTPAMTATPTVSPTATATFYKSTETQTVTPIPTESDRQKIKVLVQYPQPVTGDERLKLSYSITKSTEELYIKIYTVGLRFIRKAVIGSGLTPGGHTWEADAELMNGLSNGTYLYVLEDLEKSMSQTGVIIRIK